MLPCRPAGRTAALETRHNAVTHVHLPQHHRYHWGALEAGQRDQLKTAGLGLVAGGTRGVLEEPLFIKEKIVRAIVEMAKRQWPQAWPSLLPDLITICNMGVCVALIAEQRKNRGSRFLFSSEEAVIPAPAPGPYCPFGATAC
jgi:hypothetical protein